MQPWQNWLTTLTQPSHAYQQGWQQSAAWWSQAHQWPAYYSQTVASIMVARTQAVAQWWQAQPRFWLQASQCQTWADAVGCCAQWSAHTATSCLNLDTFTQAQRAFLWQQGQQVWPRPQTNWFTSPGTLPGFNVANWPQTIPAWPTTWPTASAAPAATAPQPMATPSTPTPAPKKAAPNVGTTPSSPWPATPTSTTPPTPVATKPNPQPVLPTLAPAFAPVTAPKTPTTGNVISSTATSVMRGATGSTIAAAAAARRSVVARRSTSRRVRPVTRPR